MPIARLSALTIGRDDMARHREMNRLLPIRIIKRLFLLSFCWNHSVGLNSCPFSSSVYLLHAGYNLAALIFDPVTKIWHFFSWVTSRHWMHNDHLWDVAYTVFSYSSTGAFLRLCNAQYSEKRRQEQRTTRALFFPGLSNLLCLICVRIYALIAPPHFYRRSTRGL